MTEQTPDAFDRARQALDKADQQAEAVPNAPTYRELAHQVRERTVQRHDERLQRVARLQRRVRLQLTVLVILAMLGLASLASWLLPRIRDEVPAAPEQLATWVAQQQLIEQLRKVQQWLSEGQAQSARPPPQNFEELQAWLDQIELNPELQSTTPDIAAGGSGFVPFQCPIYPIDCPVEDIPAADGEYRVELSRLVRNANIMLADNGDCEGTVNLIREYGSLFGWRRQEAITKARTELSVARCFMNRGDTDNGGIHFIRTFCASVADPNPDQAMNALYGLARIAYLAQDMTQVRARVECSESLLDYHLRKATNIATLHHFVSLALMHYEFLDDTHEAIRLQEKALSLTRDLLSRAEPDDQEEHQSLLLTLQLNLMEGYITVGQPEPMAALYEEVNRNPLLEDSDRLVALGMLVMQDLIDDRPSAAARNLDEILRRYQALAEFNTLWSWDAFDRWQASTRSRRSAILDRQITDLRQALSPPRSPDALQKLYRLRAEVGS